MKAFLVILLASTMQSIVEISTVSAQTVVIGHITAEVVESVSVSSLAITVFDLKNENNQTLVIQSEIGGINYENLYLGGFKINSGEAIACNVVFKPAILTDEKGNGFTLEVSAPNTGQAHAYRSDGNQTLHLNGKAHMAHGQASGLYQGSYTTVFAYN